MEPTWISNMFNWSILCLQWRLYTVTSHLRACPGLVSVGSFGTSWGSIAYLVVIKRVTWNSIHHRILFPTAAWSTALVLARYNVKYSLYNIAAAVAHKHPIHSLCPPLLYSRCHPKSCLRSCYILLTGFFVRAIDRTVRNDLHTKLIRHCVSSAASIEGQMKPSAEVCK